MGLSDSISWCAGKLDEFEQSNRRVADEAKRLRGQSSDLRVAVPDSATTSLFNKFLAPLDDDCAELNQAGAEISRQVALSIKELAAMIPKLSAAATATETAAEQANGSTLAETRAHSMTDAASRISVDAANRAAQARALLASI
jgi:hypothetical protein